jgi:hypothetical protein
LTLFEYLAAANTLIISFAVLRLAAGIPFVLRSETRYWVHLAWVSVAISFCLIGFWTFWAFRELEWTFPLFIGVLSQTTITYVFCTLVIPTAPESVASWRDYFFVVRVPLLVTGIVMMASVLIGNWVIHGISMFQTSAMGPWYLLTLCSIGTYSAKPGVHTVLALGLPPVIVFTILMLYQPDSFLSYAN